MNNNTEQGKQELWKLLVYDDTGRVIRTEYPHRRMSREEAEQLAAMMIDTTNNGASSGISHSNS